MPHQQEVDMLVAQARFEIKKRDAEIERLRAALERLEAWSRAYPLSAFPEPDFDKAAKLLKAGGMTLDAVSASIMRRAVEHVGKTARDALKRDEQCVADSENGK